VTIFSWGETKRDEQCGPAIQQVADEECLMLASEIVEISRVAFNRGSARGLAILHSRHGWVLGAVLARQTALPDQPRQVTPREERREQPVNNGMNTIKNRVKAVKKLWEWLKAERRRWYLRDIQEDEKWW
jgi:hypothetical protein